MKEQLYKVIFNMEGIHPIFQEHVKKEYMAHRNEYADCFNKHIDRVNKEYHRLHGDINVMETDEIFIDYCRFIADRIQPYFDAMNQSLTSWELEYYIDPEEQCDICARCRILKGSRIQMLLKEVDA